MASTAAFRQRPVTRTVTRFRQRPESSGGLATLGGFNAKLSIQLSTTLVTIIKVNSLTRLSESSERREAVQSTLEAELGREVELVSTHRVYFLLARLSAAYGSYMHV